MTNYMQVYFYCRKSTVSPDYGSVYVRVSINKERLVLGSVTSLAGLDLPKSLLIRRIHWDERAQRVNPESNKAEVINKAIEECERKLQKIYSRHDAYDLVMSVKGVKSVLREGSSIRPTIPELMKRFLDERRELGGKASTIDTYGFKFRTILAFLKYEARSEAAAEDFTPGVLKRYRTFMIKERGNSERSADKSCQVVKTLLLWAAGNEIIKKNPLLNIRVHVDKTPNLECLTQEELALVRDARLTPALRAAADCLRFACYTGLAYQDMRSLTASSVQTVEGRRCLVGYRMKTGTDFYVPISQPVAELMAKYGGTSLPLPRLDEYNGLLRQIMLTLNIDKKITSHTARKTFADWCINELGLTEEATIVAMGQKDARELTPYRKTRPKRLLSEFPEELLAGNSPAPKPDRGFPFRQIHKAS